MTKFPLLILITIACATRASAQSANPTTLPSEWYLFTSFRGNGDGLHLAWSNDGLHWSALNNDHRYLTPEVGGKLMRDPCILLGPDGTFRMVWTTGWSDKTIGYASSMDLIQWTEQKAIPVMEHEPTAANSWAPEIFYDAPKQQYMIFWATTIPGRFTAGENAGDRAGSTMLNHRIYSTSTKDFVTFTPTKLFYDPGFSVIDATLIQTGDKIHMVLKDETLNPPKKHLRIATANSIDGPWTLAQTFTPPGQWVEGPSVVKIGDWYYCYFDMYMAHRYGAMRTKDFATWEDVTPQLQFNVPDIRHGTAFKVSRNVMAKLFSEGGGR